MTFSIGIALSFTAALAWGISSVLFKVGLKKTRPLTATYIKGIIAVPLLLLIALVVYGKSSFAALFVGIVPLYLFLAALTLMFGDLFALIGMKKIDVSIAQPVSSIYPLFSTLFLLLSKVESITIIIIIGTLTITAGVVIISYYSQKLSRKRTNNENVQNGNHKTVSQLNFEGIIFSVLAAVSWGGAIVFSKITLTFPNVEVITLVGVRNGILVVIMTTVGAVDFLKNRLANPDQHKIKIEWKELSILALGGVIAWVCGGVSFFTSVKLIGAGISTPISSISPLVVLLLGSVGLKEKITVQTFIGVVFIIVGSILLSL